MTTHLSPREFVQALESDGADARVAHLDTCEACRRELAELRSLMSTLSVDQDVPEPSPLFWNHFSERVRVATQADTPAGNGWRSLTGWRTVVMAGATAVLVIAVAMQSQRDRIASHEPSTAAVQTADSTSATSTTADPAAGDQEAWDFMAVLASDVSSDEWHGVAAAAPGAADTLAANLTPEQQRELARLLRAEIGGTE